MSLVLAIDRDSKFCSHVTEVEALQSAPVNEPVLIKVNTSTQNNMKEKEEWKKLRKRERENR